MPAQRDRWRFTSHVKVKAARAVIAANHICAYTCFLR